MLKLLQNVTFVYRVLLCKHEQSATMISATEILLQCYIRVPLLMLDELEKNVECIIFVVVGDNDMIFTFFSKQMEIFYI
jgi:hypothetical protein